MGTLFPISSAKSKGRLIPLSSSINSDAATASSTAGPDLSATSAPAAVSPANAAAAPSTGNITTPSAVTSPSGGRLISIRSTTNNSSDATSALSTKNPLRDWRPSYQQIGAASVPATTLPANLTDGTAAKIGQTIGSHIASATDRATDFIASVPRTISNQTQGNDVGNALARQSGRNTSPVQPSALAREYASVMTPQERQFAQSLSIPELGAYINKNRSDFNQRVTEKYNAQQDKIARTIEQSVDGATKSRSATGRNVFEIVKYGAETSRKSPENTTSTNVQYMTDAEKEIVRRLGEKEDFKAIEEYYNALLRHL